ncbi:Wall-associated receptor kinase galacturonan-binding protein [Arachis hypogaea]|nr:Wall-associated receptor kinase galacturonan-binding protein [Arachis hypogaea]
MYELECEKNVAMLWLPKEVKYKVEAINYKNYTIRLVDPNIEECDCSFLPRHLLYKFNFSDASDYEFAWKQKDVNNAYHATQLQDSVGPWLTDLSCHGCTFTTTSIVDLELSTSTTPLRIPPSFLIVTLSSEFQFIAEFENPFRGSLKVEIIIFLLIYICGI